MSPIKASANKRLQTITRLITQFQKLLPFDSTKSAPWTSANISRVLVRHAARNFNPEVSRDLQDLFNLLIRQRQTDIRLKYRIALLAEEKYSQEVALDNQLLVDSRSSLLKEQAS